MLRLSCCWIFRLVALHIASDASVNLPVLDVRNLLSACCRASEAHHVQGHAYAVAGFATSLSALLSGFALH